MKPDPNSTTADHTGSLASQQQQKKLKALSAATMRGLSADPTVHYRGNNIYQDNNPLPLQAVHLQQHINSIQNNELAVLRGHIDAISLRLKHSDKLQYQQCQPQAPIARLVFEMLEQFRVESLAPATLLGMRQNLEYAFQHWCNNFYQSGLTESKLGMLLYTLALLCRSRIMALPIPHAAEDLIEMCRADISPQIGHALAPLRKLNNNQTKFAHSALIIADIMAELIDYQLKSTDDTNDGNEDQQQTLRAFSILLEFDDIEESIMAAALTGESKVFTQNHQGYQVFSRAYDQEVYAGTLVRKALLQEYRQKLELQINRQAINVKRLAKQLQNALGIPQDNGWQFGVEAGYIDGRRLSQLISSPNEQRIFTIQQQKLQPDCIVDFLIDCSGSMKQHTAAITLIVDIMTRALDIAGVTTEVLGFTTNSWNGGRIYKDWCKQGKPRYPGRLNETCHMIFKDADTAWRRAKTNIAALMKTDLFREGIDGEAVEWSCQRLLKRPESRRILIVISDGCPMDTATNLANDKFYLDNHLKEIVNKYQAHIDIMALGVGLDLSPYYQNNIAMDLSETVENQLFFDIAAMLAKR